MNAALLLMTSACFAGADPAPPAIKPAPAPAVIAAPAAGCNDCGCEKESWFGKLRGRFHRGGCGCDTCDTCAKPAPAPAPKCDTCCEHESFFDKLRSRMHHHDCCDTCAKPAPAPKCDTCCEHESLFGKLRGRFHRGGDCGCDNCGAAGTIGPVGPRGEPIPPPREGAPAKKMPEGGKAQLIIPQPVAAPTLEVTPTSALR